MSRFILEDELLSAVKEETFIKNGSEICCEGLKYDFRVSSKFVSPRFNKRERDFDERDVDEFVIKPGETAFVTTEETLELPNDVFCQLSTKRKLSHEGILVLGGFCVDPNYKGKLFFGLHNLTREDYPFKPGKKLIAGVFYKLDPEEIQNIHSDPVSLYDFPDDLLKNIKTFQSASTETLENKIFDLSKEISLLRDQIDTDKTWKEEFRQGLSQNNKQISEIGESIKALSEKLGQEIDDRKAGESKLKSKFSIIQGIGIILGAIFGGGVVSLIVMYLAGILNFG